MSTGLEDLQNVLPVQILVFCSLGVQFTLFLCAGVRRRETSSILSLVRVLLLWLAYNFGDTIATFALGRLSISTDKGNHPLVALWAPFLLLHLAGPDNIAAYALQDNQLSLRSLKEFVAQVIGGVFFLYKYRNIGGHYLGLASRSMFVVAVAKYWERWLALQRGNPGSIRDSLKKEQPRDEKLKEVEGHKTLDKESSVLRRAHLLFYICKCGMVDSSEDKLGTGSFRGKIDGVDWWTVVEIELSLMYDILYTKAAVIHTWHGYIIRVISPLTILTSLLLFHFSEEDNKDSRDVDTAMTYLLFGSALFMEGTSLLNALGSSWMFNTLRTTRIPWIRSKLLCSGRWDRLRGLVVYLNSLVTCGEARRWSGNMGQYNILHFCTRPKTVLTRPLLGWLADLPWVGLGELWNRKHFSGAIKMSDHESIQNCITRYAHLLYMEGKINKLGMIRDLWGMTTLVRHNLLGDDIKETLGDEFQEGIIIWHIGTDFFLSKCNSGNASLGLVRTIKALSNYMMFLLVERPYMLPGISQNKLYERTCQVLEAEVPKYDPIGICAVFKSLSRWRDDPGAYTSLATRSRTDAEKLYNKYEPNREYKYETVRLNYSATVARELLKYEDEHGTDSSLELLFEVWTDMLVYAGNRCSRESHAKKLSSGGELTTIVWLLVEHFHQAALEYDNDNQASAKDPLL